MQRTVVVSVNTAAERDIIVQNIYNQLKNNSDPKLVIQKDRLNRVRVLYNEGPPEYNLQSHVCTYLVVILPITFNLSPLSDISGSVSFHLDRTIEKVSKLLTKLKSIHGDKLVKENTDVSAFEELVRCLH